MIYLISKIIIIIPISLANEREVQNVHKQAQVRKTCKEKKVGMLRANRSIEKVKYKFILADFVKKHLEKPSDAKD